MLETDILPEDHVLVAEMQYLLDDWRSTEDKREIYLEAMQEFVQSLLSSWQRRQFTHPSLIHRILERHSDRYFIALTEYQSTISAAPTVWQIAHNIAREPRSLPIHCLLSGLNASLNHDLILAWDDALRWEWSVAPEQTRLTLQEDFEKMMHLMANRLESIQDRLVPHETAVRPIIDSIYGPLEEIRGAALIMKWKRKIWKLIAQSLDTTDPAQRAHLLLAIERDAAEIGHRLKP